MQNRQWRFVRPVRRAVQWAVIIGLIFLPWLSMHGWTKIYGSFFALDVYGVPFSDPVSVFWPLIHGETPTRLWMGVGLTLALALLFGRFFCGWICPYGLLSEYAHTAHQKMMHFVEKYGREQHRKVESEADAAFVCSQACLVDNTKMCYCAVPHACLTNEDNVCAAASAQPSLMDAMRQGLGEDAVLNTTEDTVDNSSGFWMRVCILVLAIGSSVFFATPLLQWLAMPGSLSLLPVQGWYGGEAAYAAIGLGLILPLVMLTMEALTGLRLWCKWLCPQAVLLALAAKSGRPFLHVRWDEKSCKCASSYRPCVTACSLRLRSRQRGGPSRGECMQCAACVSVCHCKGSGALRLGLPTPKKTLREE